MVVVLEQPPKEDSGSHSAFWSLCPSSHNSKGQGNVLAERERKGFLGSIGRISLSRTVMALEEDHFDRLINRFFL